MQGRAFNSLLSGRRLGTLLRWQRARRCPCTAVDGESNPKCGVCSGRGRFYEDWSDEFRAGLIGQESKTLMQLLKQMGGTVNVGDAVLVIPSNAPCYDNINTFDRIQVVDATDTPEWVLVPASPVRLPPTADPIDAFVLAADGKSVVPVPFPVAGADGRISVAVATTIRFRVARLYEVSRDLPKVRGFNDGSQPKRVALVRVDWTVR